MRIINVLVFFLYINLFLVAAPKQESGEEIAKLKIKSVLPTDYVSIKEQRDGGKSIYDSLEKMYLESEESDIVLRREIVNFMLDTLYKTTMIQPVSYFLYHSRHDEITKNQETKIFNYIKSDFEKDFYVQELCVMLLLTPGKNDYIKPFKNLIKLENKNTKAYERNCRIINRWIKENGGDDELNNDLLKNIESLFVNSDTVPINAVYESREFSFRKNAKFYEFAVSYIVENPNKIINILVTPDLDFVYSTVSAYFYDIFTLALKSDICQNVNYISEENGNIYFRDIDTETKKCFLEWCKNFRIDELKKR